VSLNKKKEHLQLQISDDGIGIKNEEELKSGSFGFSLVQSFARKLDAELSFDHQDGLAITAKIKKFVLTK